MLKCLIIINIVEKTSGKAPDSIGNSSLAENDSVTIDKTIKHYENYPSICKIKNNQNKNKTFEFPEAKVEDINKIIKSLNPKKATGPDGIPIKVIMSPNNVIDSHITNIINHDLNIDKYSDEAKTALVRPLFKKDDRDKIKNYRPVSILNGFSKIYERFLLNSLSEYVENTLSEFIAAYRKTYSSNNVLLRLIENWKKHLDNKNIVGTVLMDLSKAFDCIPHDLLIAKLHAYGITKKSQTFLYSYLKRRKQGVKINDTESLYQILLSGVPQGSILGPVLFNLFINDLFLFIKEADLANFADDNTLYVSKKNLAEVLEVLERECETAINWFKENNMIKNPDKFQTMIITSNKEQNNAPVKINGVDITPESSVRLLGIEIDNKLNFEKHISTLCNKVNNQLNAICRLQPYMGQKEKETIIITFVYSNFNYGSLIWHFCNKKSQNKIEKIQERWLKVLLNDYTSNYEELLENSKSVPMKIKRLRTIIIVIFKTLNNQNANFMKEIFHHSPNLTHRKHNNYVHPQHTTRFGTKSLRALGAHLWNLLPENIKSTESFIELKNFTKTWPGPNCNCDICNK